MFPYLNTAGLNMGQDIRSLSFLSSANLLNFNGVFIPHPQLYFPSNQIGDLLSNPKSNLGMNHNNIINPINQAEAFGKTNPRENIQKFLESLNIPSLAQKGQTLLPNILGNEFKLGQTSQSSDHSNKTFLSDISSLVHSKKIEDQKNKKINSDGYDTLTMLHNHSNEEKRKRNISLKPSVGGFQPKSNKHKSAFVSREKSKQTSDGEDIEKHESLTEETTDSITQQYGSSVLIDLIKDFPDWDLGDIINFLTTETDPLVIEETKKRAVLEKEEAMKRALEEAKKLEEVPIPEEESEEEEELEEIDENGRKRIKTRLWKKKDPSQIKPSNVKNNKGYVNRTFLLKVKQLLEIENIDEEKVHKLLVKHQMEPKKALKSLRKNLEHYKNEFVFNPVS
jgi:hypothetical protein